MILFTWSTKLLNFIVFLMCLNYLINVSFILFCRICTLAWQASPDEPLPKTRFYIWLRKPISGFHKRSFPEVLHLHPFPFFYFFSPVCSSLNSWGVATYFRGSYKYTLFQISLGLLWTFPTPVSTFDQALYCRFLLQNLNVLPPMMV